jgi:signal transduction histidine kinase
VSLVAREDGLQVTVADDGVGFDTAAVTGPTLRSGWGMLTMRERARNLGGLLTVSSETGRGTQVVVEIRSQ